MIGGKVLYTEVFNGAEFTIYEDEIFYIRYPDYLQLDLEMAMKGDEILSRLNLRPHYFIAEFQTFSDVSAEAKKYFASEEVTKLGLCHAIFLKSKTLKLLANAYLKFNKPKIPTKFFSSVEKAQEWVDELKAKNNFYVKKQI